MLKRVTDDFLPEAHLKNLRVLVVDDEMMVAMLLEDMLIELGCSVVGPVPNVAAALERLESERIDVALLDVNLSFGQSGYPVADDMVHRGIPFAFVTGYGSASLHPDYGDAPTLQKPFHLTALLRVVSQLAAGIAPRQESRRA